MPLLNEEREPTPAEMFEAYLGTGIFRPWTEVLLEHAPARAGDRVLDLACATGIVARRVAPIVGDAGRVVGVDITPGMLEVARERARAEGADIDWIEGDATQLDLPDAAFDLVLCQQGLQFFPDPQAALREMRRVLAPGGRVGITVWQSLEHQPVYRALFEAEARHLGLSIADVASPFMFGDADRLRGMLDDTGFERVDVVERTIDVEFPDPDRFVAMTVVAAASFLPEFDAGDAAQRQALVGAIVRDAGDALRRHRSGDRIRFPMPNLVAVAHAPA